MYPPDWILGHISNTCKILLWKKITKEILHYYPLYKLNKKFKNKSLSQTLKSILQAL